MHIPPDWGTFFALIVSFLVFWFIFDRLFFGPFLRLLGERERKLKDLGARAEQLLKEEKAAGEERERQLAVVRREALAARDAERRRAEAEAARLIEEAKAEAHSALERVRAGIESELRAGEREIEQFSRALAVELASRVLGRPIDGSAQGTPHN
ncbi:MAG TPA: ATP synthase F0 subunit B [Candidatus Binataceae bacterium]|jgi:F-type H+-transporting ATPase subunit b|nr:ATP synthase F0 subunit B [Candidatus Binataceae bacterium]